MHLFELAFISVDLSLYDNLQLWFKIQYWSRYLYICNYITFSLLYNAICVTDAFLYIDIIIKPESLYCGY